MASRPAASVPTLRTPGGLPLGAHFIAPPGDEPVLLRLVAGLEQTLPWADREPPLFQQDTRTSLEVGGTNAAR